MDKNKLFWVILLVLVFGIVLLIFFQPQEPAPVVLQEEEPEGTNEGEGDFLEEKQENTVVLIETSLGNMKVSLFDSLVPITVGNFKKLVEEGFYNGTIFHRVISDFMVQGGDPQGNGTGGPGYTIEDEFVKELRHNKKGIFSMANAGPNTGGSQFFITLVPTPWLDDKHSIFGELIEGEDVLDKIAGIKKDENDKPLEEIKVISMKIVEE